MRQTDNRTFADIDNYQTEAIEALRRELKRVQKELEETKEKLAKLEDFYWESV